MNFYWFIRAKVLYFGLKFLPYWFLGTTETIFSTKRGCYDVFVNKQKIECSNSKFKKIKHINSADRARYKRLQKYRFRNWLFKMFDPFFVSLLALPCFTWNLSPHTRSPLSKATFRTVIFLNSQGRRNNGKSWRDLWVDLQETTMKIIIIIRPSHR